MRVSKLGLCLADVGCWGTCNRLTDRTRRSGFMCGLEPIAHTNETLRFNTRIPRLLVGQVSTMLILNIGPCQPSVGSLRAKTGKQQTTGFEPLIGLRTDRIP